ncbi:MAG TPA: hypothetical protein VIA06_22340 [Candidatus Dormibacteraeota bacterium]|jgi:hypothetical protein|nr:hypothetical protein [Candidatus Dormibacteraeota bacterium]
MTTTPQLAALIAWGSIGLVLVFALITGAVVVGAFSFGLVGLDRYQKARGNGGGGSTTVEAAAPTAGDPRPSDPANAQTQDRESLAFLSLIVAVFCFAICVLGIAAGLWAMLNKVS